MKFGFHLGHLGAIYHSIVESATHVTESTKKDFEVFAFVRNEEIRRLLHRFSVPNNKPSANIRRMLRQNAQRGNYYFCAYSGGLSVPSAGVLSGFN